MKNLYIIIIALAFFSNATAQSIPTQSLSVLDFKSCVAEAPDDMYSHPGGNFSRSDDFTNQSGYNGIIVLSRYNILWVFNDVGNVSTHRNGNGNNTIPETESSNSSMVVTSVYPLPAKDHLNFSFGADINSGMILIYDANGKTILAQKFSGNDAIISSSDFLPGIYFYQVSENNKSIGSGKFIRE